MDKKELLEKFNSLFMEAKTSGDSEDIDVSLLMLQKAVSLLADLDLRSAKEFVECYEGTLNFYNFFTESEARNVVEKLVNYDGSKGPKWRDPEELFRKVVDVNGKVECRPHYNKWALYSAMNKAHSDQGSLITKWVGDDKDKYFEACYELALTNLKDKDRLYWIRPYYGLSK